MSRKYQYRIMDKGSREKGKKGEGGRATPTPTRTKKGSYPAPI